MSVNDDSECVDYSELVFWLVQNWDEKETSAMQGRKEENEHKRGTVHEDESI